MISTFGCVLFVLLQLPQTAGSFRGAASTRIRRRNVKHQPPEKASAHPSLMVCPKAAANGDEGGNIDEVDTPVNGQDEIYSEDPSKSFFRSLPPPSLVEERVCCKLHPSITSIPAESWDSFLQDDDSFSLSGEEHGVNELSTMSSASSPFLEHAWLRCLEESGSASPFTGWAPQHVEVSMDGTVVAYVPMYIKGNSMGEFIFDSAWADAAQRSFGIEYYPKLLVGVPFTPAAGSRILIDPRIRRTWTPNELTALRKLIGRFLKETAQSNGISSVHFNFVTDEEATSLSHDLKEWRRSKKGLGGIIEDGVLAGASIGARVREFLDPISFADANDCYLRRTSIQYHWQNSNSKRGGAPYDSFDDYLGCFKSKRRITIRRERRKVNEDKGIRIDAIAGRDILEHDGLVDRMFEIYLSTVDKMIWGRQYLSKEFFQLLSKSDFVKNLCFLCARERSSGEEFHAKDVIAGTFNIVKNGVFYGRYWGCLKEVKNLHFETCYWAAIDYCIINGLTRMEPGAGGGDYKWARGFDPVLIHSVHYICHAGLRREVGQFLDSERESSVEYTKYLMERSVVGSGRTGKGR